MPRHRSGRRWESKFGQFVGVFGVEELAGELSIDSTAVYHWISGKNTPRLENALAIQRLAKEKRITLSIDEIVGHSRQVRGE